MLSWVTQILKYIVVDSMATAWFLECASVHPSGKRNTTVASPTVDVTSAAFTIFGRRY